MASNSLRHIAYHPWDGSENRSEKSRDMDRKEAVNGIREQGPDPSGGTSLWPKERGKFCKGCVVISEHLVEGELISSDAESGGAKPGVMRSETPG